MFDQIKSDYKVVESPELNSYIKNKYEKVYSCAKGANGGEGAHQETYKVYEIGPVEEDDLGFFFPTETTLKEHNDALESWENWETSPDPGIMLNELHRLGEIPAGKYLLMIWW